MPTAVSWVARLTPSGALTEALSRATQSLRRLVRYRGPGRLGGGVGGRGRALVPVHLTPAPSARFSGSSTIAEWVWDGSSCVWWIGFPMPSVRTQRLIAVAVPLSQALIAVTGSIVRVTASGLGCLTRPQCFPGSFTPVPHSEVPVIHQAVEFGNRLITFAVVITAMLAVLAVTRARRRREILVYAWLMPASTVLQAIIGGITVRTGLLWWTVAVICWCRWRWSGFAGTAVRQDRPAR